MDFFSGDKLKEYIREDAGRFVREPVRFINVDSFNDYIELKRFLCSFTNVLKLSSFCDPDRLPNIDSLYNKIKNLDNKTTLDKTTSILPLSELLRVSDKLCRILDNIKSIARETLVFKKIHLYIPLFGMEAELKNKYKDCSLFLRSADIDTYKLIIMHQDIDLPQKAIKGFKSYLQYWEDTPKEQEIVLSSEIAEFYKGGVCHNSITYLTSAYDILAYYSYIPQGTDKKWGDEKQWKELLSKKKKLGDLLSAMFPLGVNESEKNFNNPNNLSDFEKWLFFLLLKMEASSGYMKQVINKCQIFNDILPEITLSIFDDYSEDYARMRKSLLKAFNVKELKEAFWQKYEKAGDDRYKYLTDITKRERTEYINLYKSFCDLPQYKESIKLMYPDLNYYLQDFTFTVPEITEYFKQYKRAKLSDIFSDEFVSKVNEIAEADDKLLLKIDPRDAIINRIYNDNCYILWVDGLSLDESCYIEAKIQAMHPDNYDYETEIGRANFPTTTEYNTSFLEGRKYGNYSELDKLKHSGSFPDYIVRELSLLDEVTTKALGMLGQYETVIITSDHGFSRGAIKRYKSLPTEKSSCVMYFGRYCSDATVDYEKRYKCCIKDGDFYCMANYKRFSVSGNQQCEIHGGATLEEALVPIITIRKKQAGEEFKVTPITEELPNKRPYEIKFRINKKCSELIAVINEKTYQCKCSDDIWLCYPDSLPKGASFTVTVYHKHRLIGTFDVRRKLSFTENELF